MHTLFSRSDRLDFYTFIKLSPFSVKKRCKTRLCAGSKQGTKVRSARFFQLNKVQPVLYKTIPNLKGSHICWLCEGILQNVVV